MVGKMSSHLIALFVHYVIQKIYSYTHRIRTLRHRQLLDLCALMIIIMMADVQCSEEAGQQTQDVDDGQFIRGIWLQSDKSLQSLLWAQNMSH